MPKIHSSKPAHMAAYFSLFPIRFHPINYELPQRLETNKKPCLVGKSTKNRYETVQKIKRHYFYSVKRATPTMMSGIDGKK